MHYKFWIVVLAGVLLVSMLAPTAGAALFPVTQDAVEKDNTTKRTEQVLWEYNKKYYPTRSSIPPVYYYNDGEYAGNLNITVVISYVNGDGKWWGVTYEGPVYPSS
ncbi:hypothetical protein [Paenibacillus popilliae]|uniref:FOG: PAS n=1 Tax=Paenibacillus popilliae ATCC 14706 TaxID=1212764 RepID=M9LLZ1_PAEPP|nr:hypothetical protein [Paenibacillus popilliae]GAC41106.1 FOG: PAS [Paenibacillus popilliae ATCC 14706]